MDGEHLPYMLIGGAAAALWGNPRLTLDADVTVWIPDYQLTAVIQALQRRCTPRTGDPLQFVHDTRVLPVTLPAGLPADITFGQLPFEEAAIQRADVKMVAGYPVRVCTVADLILHKVVSDRPRDQDDLRFLIGRYAGTLVRADLTRQVAGLADLLTKPDILSRYLACWK